MRRFAVFVCWLSGVASRRKSVYASFTRSLAKLSVALAFVPSAVPVASD